MQGYQIGRLEIPEIDFTVQCSKGFYVRSLAHDIGEVLGCGAHLSALRRTKSGKFSVEGAVTISELKTAPREELYNRLISIQEIAAMRGIDA